jgi:septum formation topological specificity factor MinE
MDISPATRELIISTAASFPQGPARRRFMADTLSKLRLGQRQAAQLFGWGRDTLRKAAQEARTGLTCVDATSRRGRKPAEHHLPNLLEDIKDLVKDHVQTDPSFRSTRLYCRLTAKEVRQQLVQRKGYDPKVVPSRQTLNGKLNALGFCLRKVAKCRPQKK